MLKINLIVMGDIKEQYFTEAIMEYKKGYQDLLN